MAMENKRIIQLSTERTTLGDDDYTIVDSDTNGTAKYRLSRLKETDTTLSVSGMAADAAATGQAINAEATARGNAVTAEAEARAAAVTAEATARQTADTTLQGNITAEATARAAADTAIGEDIDDLKSAMSDAETAIEQLEEQKADINGTYDDMTVGTAENVLSNKYALESVPYHFRKTGGDASVGSRLKEKIVGGTVAWNQLERFNRASETLNGVSYTNNGNGSFTLTGEASANTPILPSNMNTSTPYVEGRVYLGFSNIKSPSVSTIGLGIYINSSLVYLPGNSYALFKDTYYHYTGNIQIGYRVASGYNPDGMTIYGGLCDLTQMFGTEIADYIYNLEQTTSGSGVALFRKLFNKEYYAYDAGSLQSVSGLVSHDEVGFNQWDEETESGYWDKNTGIFTTSQNWKCSKNYIPCIPNTTYYADVFNLPTGSTPLQIIYYDADKNYIQWHGSSIANTMFTTPNNAYFMTFYASVNVFDGDICINLSDPSRNGEYEPYVKHSYPLDDSLTLRGLFKLDANNNIYADGDWYESEGKKTERYEYKSSGFSRGAKDSSGKLYAIASLTKSGLSDTSTSTCINNKLPSVGLTECLSNADNGTKSICVYGTSVYAGGFVGSESELDNLLTNLELVYELVTPTVTEAQPFINPQICDRYGTEEYVSTSIVPVGHETEYYEDVVAKVDGLPWDFSTLIAPTESTYIATRNYTTGSLLIVDNILYKVTANIANGGAITPNTNCTATTLAEIISALS